MGPMIIDYHDIVRKKKHLKRQLMTSGNQDDKSSENMCSVARTIRSKYYGLNGSVISDNQRWNLSMPSLPAAV